MNVSVGQRWETFIARIVRSGRDGSASEVVRKGLRLVEEREAKPLALRHMLDASIKAGGEAPMPTSTAPSKPRQSNCRKKAPDMGKGVTVMTTLDWSQCPGVESVPGKRSGAWVFRGTRTPVSVVFDNLEVGASIDEIMEWFHLTHEQVVTVIEFVSRSLEMPAAPASASTADAHTIR